MCCSAIWKTEKSSGWSFTGEMLVQSERDRTEAGAFYLIVPRWIQDWYIGDIFINVFCSLLAIMHANVGVGIGNHYYDFSVSDNHILLTDVHTRHVVGSEFGSTMTLWEKCLACDLQGVNKPSTAGKYLSAIQGWLFSASCGGPPRVDLHSS